MKHFGLSIAVCTFLVGFVFTPVLNAQTNLQGAGGGLQPQSSQTQETGAVQPETAQLQNNSAGNALNQTQPSALQVFSSPNQSQPDVVANASPELKTDINNTNHGGLSSFLKVLLAVLAIIFTVILCSWILQNFYLPPVQFAPELREEASSAGTTEPKPKKPEKTTPSAKKKRKSKKRH